MDFLFWLLATIGGWIVTKMLDALCERWQKTRTRRTPLTDTQVLAYHRRRFRTMAFLVAWCALMLVGSIATAPAVHSVWWYAAVVFIASAGVYAALRLPRYRRRVREAQARIRRSQAPRQSMPGPGRP